MVLPFVFSYCTITEIKARNGKPWVTAVFDCFDPSVIGLAMDRVQTPENTAKAYPGARGAIIHSDRGTSRDASPFKKKLRNAPCFS